MLAVYYFCQRVEASLDLLDQLGDAHILSALQLDGGNDGLVVEQDPAVADVAGRSCTTLTLFMSSTTT